MKKMTFAKYWAKYSDRNWLAFRGDAFKCIDQIRDDSIDLIITDLPYESLNKWRDSKKALKRYKDGETTGTRIPRLRDWFPVISDESIPDLMDEFYRVLAPNSHCYIFCDDPTSTVIENAVSAQPKKERFKFWKRIVWDKMTRGMGYRYANRHEFIVYLEKGNRKLNGSPVSVLQHKRVKSKDVGRKLHPTEKPVALIRILVDNSSGPDDLVLDPFCGSGATGVAALQAGREFLGFDIRKSSVAMTRERLRAIDEDKMEVDSGTSGSLQNKRRRSGP